MKEKTSCRKSRDMQLSLGGYSHLQSGKNDVSMYAKWLNTLMIPYNWFTGVTHYTHYIKWFANECMHVKHVNSRMTLKTLGALPMCWSLLYMSLYEQPSYNIVWSFCFYSPLIPRPSLSLRLYCWDVGTYTNILHLDQKQSHDVSHFWTGLSIWGFNTGID